MQFYQTHSPIQRVTRSRPCAICGRSDWCGYTADGLAICMRIDAGSIGTAKNGGFVHRIGDGPTRRPVITSIIAPTRSTIDLGLLAKQYQTAIDPDRLSKFAAGLGVSESSLIELGIGRDVERNAWTFPMCDAAGKVIGLRLRTDTGKKFAATGGREGIFIPRSTEPGSTIYIAEGPTDTAAILDLDLYAIGRPSCTGATAIIRSFIAAKNPARVAIAADGDEPGRRGAAAMAVQLAAVVADVRVITPPGGLKDFREAKRAGMNFDDLCDLVDRADQVRVAIECEVRE